MMNKPQLFTGDLKPCPFCGGEASVSQGEQDGRPFYYIECDDCTGTADSVTAWNKRQSAPPEVERILIVEALGELVCAIERKWEGEPERRRANALSPRIEDALKKAKELLDPSKPQNCISTKEKS